MKALLILFPLVILSCLIGIGISTYLFLTYESNDDYSIVFDAGSSGTRMFIYKWNSNYKPESSPKLLIEQVANCHTDDKGIDKIKDKEELIKKFSKCIAMSLEIIPEDRRARTKINLAATAGMRLLQKTSMSNAIKTMNFIKEYLSTLGFLLNGNSQVQVISGKEEAINAWISANYIEQNFKEHKTNGVMDLGGGSTQIIFVPEHADPKYSRTVRIFGHNYQTYSQSFLCYGTDQAEYIYEANAAKESSYNPACFPTNSTFILTKEKIKNSPCINGLIYKDTPSASFLEADHQFTGASNYDRCAADVRKLFNRKETCKVGTDYCSFKDVFIADVKPSKFMAISAYWYMAENTRNLFNTIMDHTIDDLRNKTKTLCSMSLDELVELSKKSGGIKLKRLKRMCFANVYTLELLEKYGFENFDNIKFVKRVNGKKISWTLGYLINALNHPNYLPLEDQVKNLSFLSYFFIFVSLSLLIFISLYSFCVNLKQRHYSNEINM